MYTFAGARGFISDGFNPVRGIERYRENGRERFLSLNELERLGAALREAESAGVPWEPDLSKSTAKHAPKAENRRIVIGQHTAAALRLLILTGARLREILHLKWEEVDFDRGLLLLPTSKTGKKTIVLNAPAIAVLSVVPRVGSYVIAGQNAGGEIEKPRTDLNRPWALVSRRAGLNSVRIHDLRHTYASFGAGGGLGLPIIGRLLGHAHAATTQRYAHLDADPLRRASEDIANKIATAMGDA
jgi:integrase